MNIDDYSEHRAGDSEEFDFDELLDDPEVHAAMSEAEERLAVTETLRDGRKQSGLSQKQVAAAMGTTQSAVSDFERGETDPQLSTIQRYARATGARVRILVDQPGSNVTRVASPYVSVSKTVAAPSASSGRRPALRVAPSYQDIQVS